MGVLVHKVLESLTTEKFNNFIDKEKVKENIRFTFIGLNKAYAELINEDFVLPQGSEIRNEFLKCASPSTIRERKKHENDIENGITTCDILFHSPSSASTFVAGHSYSGNV